MKCKVLVNLKVASGELITAGSVFEGDLPDFIKSNIENARIIEILSAPTVEKIKEENTTSTVSEPAVGAKAASVKRTRLHTKAKNK